MSTKHTNGPWVRATYIIYASQSAKAEYPIHAKKRGLIAKAYRASDARLISAAPELLAACIDADWHSLDLPQAVREKISSAIAKATGAHQ